MRGDARSFFGALTSPDGINGRQDIQFEEPKELEDCAIMRDSTIGRSTISSIRDQKIRRLPYVTITIDRGGLFIARRAHMCPSIHLVSYEDFIQRGKLEVKVTTLDTIISQSTVQ